MILRTAAFLSFLYVVGAPVWTWRFALRGLPSDERKLIVVGVLGFALLLVEYAVYFHLHGWRAP